MKNGSKTKKQLIDELISLRQQLADLKGSEAIHDKLIQDLQLSEERMKYLISLSPVTIFTCTPSGDYGATYISSNVTDQVGYEPHEFTDDSRFWADHIHPEDRERVFDDLGSLFERDYHTHEYRFLHKDGSYRWVYDDIRLIRDEQGNPVEIIGFWMDITDMKLAGEKIAESEIKYREFANLLPQIVFEADIQGTLTFVNRSALTMSGYTQEDIEKGLNTMDLIIPEDRDRARENLQRIFTGEGPSGNEYTFMRKDGSTFPILIHTNAVIRDGHVVGLRGFAVDITDRKRAEEESQESRRRLADIIEFLPDATLVIDKDGTVTAWNRAMEVMTGVRAEEMLGKGNYEYALPFYGERRPILIDLVLRPVREIEKKYIAMKKGKFALIGEAYFPALRGDNAYLLGTASVLRNSKGEVIGAIESIHDITGRRHAEELYMTMADSAQVGIYIIQEGKIVFINHHILEYSGHSTEELIGMRILNFVHPEDMDMVRENAKKMLRGEITSPYEFRMIDKAGNIKWLMETVTNIHYEGKPAVLGNNMNITERKEVEQALQESEEKYRLLIDHANVAIFIAQDGTIKFSNPNTQALVGYSEDELAAIPFINHIHPEDRAIVVENHEKRLRGEDVPQDYSFRIISKDSKELWVMINAVLVQWNGKPATLNFLRDITLQKNMEFQLMQAQKLEGIGTLAGGIAHDFNNLLMAIQGNASLMLMNTDSRDSRYEKLKAIEDQVVTGADLTKKLLGFARLGRYELKPMDLNEIVEKSSTMFGRTKKEIVIHKKYEQALWTVEADASQVEQVLMNLYINAWQAMSGGGHIYLETGNLVVTEGDQKSSYLKPGRYVKISVTDIGMGMDEKTQARIFEPFFTTKEMGRGTGLGLAMVYGIVKGHKGYINVYSEKGMGTTFNIYLPASEREALKGEKPEEVIIKGQETILLVDDEEIIVNVMKDMLESLGYSIMVANNGRDALTIYELNKNKIDLVILDMIMPEMGGGETFDRLKKINPKIKVILSSGYSLNGEATGIVNRGCNGFIQKPVNMANLSQKIREVLGKA